MIKHIMTGLAFLTVSALASGANASPVTATLTVDNHFGLYVGDNNATNLNFIGRDSAAWTTTDSFTFNANNGQRAFVYA